MPIVAAVGLVGAAIGGVVGGALINAAIGLAISSVAQMFRKEPGRSSGSSISGGLNVGTDDPAAPFPYVFGRTRFAGVRRFIELTNSNQWLHQVRVYAAHEVEGNPVIYCNNDIVTVDSDGWASGKYAGKLRVKFYTGTPDQTADPYLVARCPSWTVDHRLRGLAYAAISMKWDQELFSQMPTINIEFDGAKVYDPRDNTQSISDPTTWKWSDNSILCAAHYARGLPSPDHTGALWRVFGTGAKDAEIIWSRIPAEANICDETVNLAEGGTQKRYTCNGLIWIDAASPSNGLDDILKSCAGTRTDMGGLISLFASAPRVSSASFSRSDLIGAPSIRVKRPMRELFTSVRGAYRGPETNYEPADVPLFRDANLISERGKESFLDFDTELTDTAAMAQRIHRIALSENQRQISATLPLPLSAFALEPNDWITYTDTERGWSNKTFIIRRRRFTSGRGIDDVPCFGVEVDVDEVDAGIWSWSTGDQTIVPPPPSTNLPIDLVVPQPTLLEPEIIEWRDRALVQLRATPATDGPPIMGYVFSYRRVGDFEFTYLPIEDDPAARVFLDVGDYDFRVQAVTSYDVTSAPAPDASGYRWTVASPRLTHRVTGLQLVGGGNNPQFTGRDANFVWRQGKIDAIGLNNPQGADVDQQDPYFAGYQVTIRAMDGTVLHEVIQTATTFSYTFDKNYRDSRLKGFKSAQRSFEIEVVQRSRYGLIYDYSVPNRLAVTNPAPALPVDLTVTVLFSQLRVIYTPPTDPDYEGTIVWASQIDGFDPAAVTPIFVGRDSFMTYDLPNTGDWYVRVAPYDGFIGDYDPTDVPLLNISPQYTVTAEGIDVDIPQWTITGVIVAPNGPGDGVTWTGGTISVTHSDGTASTYAISSGSAAWSSGEMYVYYVAGDSTLSTTTNIQDTAGNNKYVLAAYSGGKNITGSHAVIVANRLIADTAVITSSAQIASLIVNDGHIQNLSASKLIADTIIGNRIFVGEDMLVEINGDSGTQGLLFKEVIP